MKDIREIKIELTQQCPLACVHCSSSSSSKTLRHLSSEVVHQVIRDARILGVRNLSFSGGEPLIYPWLSEVLAECKKEGMRTQIYTSGVASSRLSPLSKEGAAALSALGVERLIFSVYSTDRSVHDSITGFPSLDITIEAITNAGASGLECQIHFVAFRRNYQDLVSVAALAEQLGVSKISVLRLVPHGRARNIFAEENLTCEEYQHLASCVYRIRATSRVKIRLGSPMNMLGVDDTPCTAASGSLTIDFRGRVFPCDAFKGYDFPGDESLSIVQLPLSEVLARSQFLTDIRDAVARTGNHAGCVAQAAFRTGTVASDADPDWQSLESAKSLVQLLVLP
jgi:MoaA/NifB/PqqE/SkfB family radical SAM enzyme